MDVDLVKTCQAYSKENGVIRLPVISPFHSIVWKYTEILRSSNQQCVVSGVKLVIAHEVKKISWWEEVFRIPFHRKAIFHNPSELHVNSGLIVDSLVASIMEYRSALKPTPSGLADCIRSDMAGGLYLVCNWIEKGLPISANENPHVVAL